MCEHLGYLFGSTDIGQVQSDLNRVMDSTNRTQDDGFAIPGLTSSASPPTAQNTADHEMVSVQARSGPNKDVSPEMLQEENSASIEDELRDLIAPPNADAPSTQETSNSRQQPGLDIPGAMQLVPNGTNEREVSDTVPGGLGSELAAANDLHMDGADQSTLSAQSASGHEPVTEQVDGEAEWEVDSSPYESSDSSSDDTSSDDSDDDDDDDHEYSMLTAQEQARILMQDAGSDDEGPSRGGKGGGAQIRSINEKPEEVIPKPEIEVTTDMAIEELGDVLAAVENTVVVKAKVSGEYRVLESGSLLCLKDRSVVGVVAETLGRVQEPLYTIRFTNDDAIKAAGLSEPGTPVYYVQQHSTFVFTQPLKTVKGSDASNVNDEEVGEDEMEFSDDEAEADYKRQIKQKKQERRDARHGGISQAKSHGSNKDRLADNNASMYDDTPEINYDDVDSKDDDGYTPLSRPANLHELLGKNQPPGEGRPGRGSFGSHRGRGDSHHRGGRGRGRGDRGRGGRGGRNDYSSRVHDQRGYQNNGPSQHGRPPVPSWTPNNQFQPPPVFPPSFQMSAHPQSLPVPIPQAPSLSPQNAQPPFFSPSPISPLPSSQFNWPAPGQSNAPNLPFPPPPPPPPGAFHMNQTSYNQHEAQYGPHPMSGQGGDNSAALAQVQAQLQMLQQYANNYQSPAGNQGRPN